jgi:hypothetical protein
MLIQYIRSYPPYLEAVSSLRKLRTRHAVVRRDPPNMAFLTMGEKKTFAVYWRSSRRVVLFVKTAAVSGHANVTSNDTILIDTMW